jgi:hypothetical protein
MASLVRQQCASSCGSLCQVLANCAWRIAGHSGNHLRNVDLLHIGLHWRYLMVGKPSAWLEACDIFPYNTPASPLSSRRP